MRSQIEILIVDTETITRSPIKCKSFSSQQEVNTVSSWSLMALTLLSVEFRTNTFQPKLQTRRNPPAQAT